MKVRRVVTGHAGNKSTIMSDGQSRKGRDYVNVPGMASALLWATEATPRVPYDGNDPISEKSLYVPPLGETRLMLVTFPPDSVMMSSSFDPAAAGQEYMEHMPELAQTFELDNPGMHTTDTVDYGIVLEGEVWLELDDGKQVHLRPHDVVVQNGTRHAWRNKTDKPVKMAFVIIGARRTA
jgi:mannose-6-phosphate isomerase-like protein (cupin superfamily)